MVKVTGGGRGMAAIAAHFRYISKNGRLPFEDDRGVTREGKEALHDLAEQWRHGGSFIDETSHRREAFNIMLSMPRGTDPLIVQRAAREFAKAELSDHRYVMVLHDHQANPHVHLSVRAESRHGKRLNPRKADLQRWRETFAEKLRGWGIDAEATRQATRGQIRNYEPIWRVKAGCRRAPEDGQGDREIGRGVHQEPGLRDPGMGPDHQGTVSLGERRGPGLGRRRPTASSAAPRSRSTSCESASRRKAQQERTRATPEMPRVVTRSREGPEMER